MSYTLPSSLCLCLSLSFCVTLSFYLYLYQSIFATTSLLVLSLTCNTVTYKSFFTLINSHPPLSICLFLSLSFTHPLSLSFSLSPSLRLFLSVCLCVSPSILLPLSISPPSLFSSFLLHQDDSITGSREEVSRQQPLPLDGSDIS